MDVRNIGGYVPQRLSESVRGADSRSNLPVSAEGDLHVGSSASGDNVTISEAARAALDITAWADTVRAMPDVRQGVIAEVSAVLEAGGLANSAAYRRAAQAMLAAGII